MNNEIKKIKAALRNKAVEVTVFDSTRHSKDIPTNRYVLLEDALKAIDDIYKELNKGEITKHSS